jgi:MoaA/NifB/PqqE/SkfB family radical SAM enzyme
MDASLVLTYRCNSRCQMCYTWQYPTKKEDEITVKDIEKLPQLYFVNITGGEPFLREDIHEIVRVVNAKSHRIVISTNGLLTDRIIEFFEHKDNKNIGIRISLDGLPQSNELIRGIKDGFDRSFRTLLELKAMGIKDLGIGITISDQNAKDLVPLFHLANSMGIEFAIAVVHNSYYFHKLDNKIENKDMVAREFKSLMKCYLKTRKIKNWFRAYMATGIVNRIYDLPRPLPCIMGTGSFFLDPIGEIRPCNVMEESMGNIKEKSFEEIWYSNKANEIRCKVANCHENCWMIGSVSCIMRKKIWKPAWWIIRNKWLGNPYFKNSKEY